jgi:Secretory lipase
MARLDSTSWYLYGFRVSEYQMVLMTEELEGWDVVIPDHEGPLATPIVGPTEGRTTLDGIRAAENFAAAGLEGSKTEVALSRYSGGSVPTMWPPRWRPATRRNKTSSPSYPAASRRISTKGP